MVTQSKTQFNGHSGGLFSSGKGAGSDTDNEPQR